MAKIKPNIKATKVINKKYGKVYFYLEEYKKIEQYGKSRKVLNKRVRLDIDYVDDFYRVKRTIIDLTNKNPNVSLDRVIASYTHDSIMGMIANTGFTLAQTAEHLNTTVEQLLDSRNWSNGFKWFKNPITGEEFEFVFGYKDLDSIFVKRF